MCFHFQVVGKIILLLGCLYFFICSLDFLATAFRLLGGQNTSKVFSQSELLKNPIVGVMLGVLGTVMVQSSSTVTSIIVGMVASDILNVSWVFLYLLKNIFDRFLIHYIFYKFCRNVWKHFIYIFITCHYFEWKDNCYWIIFATSLFLDANPSIFFIY